MTLRELIDQIRIRLDDIRPPYLWKDEELTQYLNDCQNYLCEKVGLLRDSTTTAICNISIVSGTQSYSLSDKIVKVLSVKYGSAYTQLYPTTRVALDEESPGWESTSGTPTSFLLDNTGKILLYPKPNANSTIYMSVVRYPLLQLVVTNDGASPEIQWQYHPKLIDGVIALAYRKQDSEAVDMAKAQTFDMIWAKNIESIIQNEANYYYFGMVASPLYGTI